MPQLELLLSEGERELEGERVSKITQIHLIPSDFYFSLCPDSGDLPSIVALCHSPDVRRRRAARAILLPSACVMPGSSFDSFFSARKEFNKQEERREGLLQLPEFLPEKMWINKYFHLSPSLSFSLSLSHHIHPNI